MDNGLGNLTKYASTINCSKMIKNVRLEAEETVLELNRIRIRP